MIRAWLKIKFFGVLMFFLFLSDLSFHIQYEDNLPFSSDIESIKVISWGFQYWF
jgi:hypothetical protein